MCRKYDRKHAGCQRQVCCVALAMQRGNIACARPDRLGLFLAAGDAQGNIRVWDLTANACSCELVPEVGTPIRWVRPSTTQMLLCRCCSRILATFTVLTLIAIGAKAIVEWHQIRPTRELLQASRVCVRMLWCAWSSSCFGALSRWSCHPDATCASCSATPGTAGMRRPPAVSKFVLSHLCRPCSCDKEHPYFKVVAVRQLHLKGSHALQQVLRYS